MFSQLQFKIIIDYLWFTEEIKWQLMTQYKCKRVSIQSSHI